MSNDHSLSRANVHDAELHYQTTGEGEPVVLIHGSLGDYRSWSLQVPALRSHFRVVSYSRRYHFPNTWTGDGSDYSAALHADDLAGLLDHLCIERAHIVSASYGSYCALVFALQYSHRAASLVIAEPPILDWLRALPGGEETIRPFFEQAWIPCREAFSKGEDEEAVRTFIDGVVGRRGAFDSFHASIRRALMDNAPEMRAECFSDRLFPRFTCQEAAEVAAPTLLLRGELSPRFFHRIMDELARCLPNAEQQTIAGASHNLNSARPRHYHRVVLDFLHRVSAGTGTDGQSA